MNLFKLVTEYYFKYKEVINYLIFGGLTTVVNFVVYFFTAKLLNIDEVLSNAIAWIMAVIFAYVTNKLFVFESKTTKKKEILKEITSFFACRAFSGILDIGLFALFVKAFKFNDIVVKVLLQIMVVIVNYIFSKLIIFKKKST